MAAPPALTAKLVSIAIIFLGSLFSGLLPAFRVFSAFPRFLLSLILCYGGGILIATSLVHILPEAREQWPTDGQGHSIKFSAEMSLCLGIFLVYIVEEIAHFLVCHDLHSPLTAGHSDHNHAHGATGTVSFKVSKRNLLSKFTKKLRLTSSTSSSKSQEKGYKSCCNCENPTGIMITNSEPIEPEIIASQNYDDRERDNEHHENDENQSELLEQEGGAGTATHTHGVHVHHDDPPNRCDEPAAVFVFAEEKTRSGEHHGHGHSHGGHGHSHGGPGTDGSSGGAGAARCHIISTKTKNNHNHHSHPNHNHGDSGDAGDGGADVGDPCSKLFIPESNSKDPQIISQGANRKDDRAKVIARLRSLVGLIALSIHAGLEGLSVGLGRDASDVWYLCLAVSAHKLVIAFCLGMEVRNASSNSCSLVQTSSSASFKFRYVLFFSLMTPLGIGIGTLITEVWGGGSGADQSAAVPVLQTLASGTLLYVAFFEVILRERARYSGKGLIQLLFVMLGWSTMVLVEIFVGEHNHGGGSSGTKCDHHSHHQNNQTNSTTTPSSLIASTILTTFSTLID